MVVYVVHSRRRRSGGEGSSSMSSKNLARLTSRPVTAAAPAGAPSSPSSSGARRSLSRAGGRPLCAASPPPPSSIFSAAPWESRSLRGDGEEDWEEVLPAGERVTACEEAKDGVVFGTPPTNDEVRAAIDSINKVFENPSAVESDAPDLRLAFSGHPSLIVNHFALDSDASEVGSDEWIEPAMLVRNSSALLTKEHQNVVNALCLLKEDISVQKMVVALSTDKNVWRAVMQNEEVKAFSSSYHEAKQTDLKGSSTAPPGFMMWVLENTQAKIKEFIEKILGVVNMLFQAGDQNYNMSDDVVRMSFMLSVFVFVVVTIARVH